MRRKAFTLVELLVVIGIIALLISILLPALAKARDSAYRSQCASNQRQLNMAYLEYAREHKQRMVYAHTSLPSGDPQNPTGILPWAFAGNTEQNIKDGALFPYVGNGDTRLYKCPADTTNNLRSFSLNIYLNGEGTSTLRKLKVTSVPHHPMVFTFIEEFDTRGSNLGSFMVQPTGDVFTDVPGFFHKGATVAFLDGHVEFFPYADSRTFQLRANNSSSPNNADLKQLQKWCGPNDPAWSN